MLKYTAKAVVLAMGCRERTRGAISIPGSRPAGVYTAGVAQSYINLQNTMVGKNVIIVANLKPRTMCGIESRGMVLAVGEGDDIVLVAPEKKVKSGIRVC